MKQFVSIVSILGLLALAACDTEKVELLKSPCAGIDGSPCGPKRPVPMNPHPNEQV